MRFIRPTEAAMCVWSSRVVSTPWPHCFPRLRHAIHTPQRGNTTKPRVKPWEMPPYQFHRPVGAGQGVVGCLRSFASEISIMVRRDRHHGFVVSPQAKVRFVPPRWGGDGWGVSLQGFHPWLCCFAPLGHVMGVVFLSRGFTPGFVVLPRWGM
jgi:hypothetical protein